MKDTDTRSLRVPGFRSGGIASGIKGNGKKDLALIVSKKPAEAAAVFTTNRFKAAPVLHDMKKIVLGKAQAIIVNSGSANAATGEAGMDDAAVMARIAAEGLGIDEKYVLVASTGSIGKRLPLDRIESGTSILIRNLSEGGMEDAAEAIMTTDRFPKVVSRSITLDGKSVSLCGIAKGAGMIEPNMATMLAFFLTDAAIEGRCLKNIFKQVMNQSFNAITVDGCMSTNDTAVILASGEAGNKPVALRSADCFAFRGALLDAAITLAAMMVRDGEGATKLIDINVRGARTRGEAKRIAYAIGRSNLVKTAFFGSDPNWGRIIAAAGSTGIEIRPESLELYFDDCLLFKNGKGVSGKPSGLEDIMKKETISVIVKLGAGKASFRLFASDLTHEYVDINALYHT